MNALDDFTDQQVQTRVFLQLLKPKAKHEIFHFRSFDDKKERNRSDLKGNLSATLGNIEAKLRRRNSQGAGVFVVINEGGQTTDKISKARAVFADTDGAPLEPLVAALTPHMVVCSSPSKWHVYWLVDDDFQLEQFKPIQKAISEKYGTDPKVCDLPRVMRLPGFTHNKGKPFLVRLDEEYLNPTLPRYSTEQIIRGLGLREHLSGSKRSKIRNAGPRAEELQHEPSYSFFDVECMLKHIDPWCGREKWRNVLFALADEYGEDALGLAIRWSRGDLWNLRSIEELGLKPNIQGVK